MLISRTTDKRWDFLLGRIEENKKRGSVIHCVIIIIIISRRTTVDNGNLIFRC